MQKEKIHFTILKGNFGWEIWHGRPDDIGLKASHNSFSHSDTVYDYCERMAGDNQAQIHFDLRG